MADPISLARWSQREAQALLGSIARYTRFVSFSKFFFLVVGAGLLGLVVILPMTDADDESVRIVFANTQKTDQPIQPKMDKPRFQGVDAQNQPYTVTADAAEQLEGNRVRLTNIEGDIMLKNSDWVSLRADRGLLDLMQKNLSLEGKVQLYQAQGYEFTTEAAQINIDGKSVQGERDIVGHGPIGIIRAKGFEITHNSAHILFKGPVRMTLYPGGR